MYYVISTLLKVSISHEIINNSTKLYNFSSIFFSLFIIAFQYIVKYKIEYNNKFLKHFNRRKSLGIAELISYFLEIAIYLTEVRL